MNKLQKAKKAYESINIPKNLNQVIENACARNRYKKENKKYVPAFVGTLAATFAVFVALINVNPSFSRAVENIPILGEVAKIFTFTEYHEESDTNLIDVRIPAIANTVNSDLENRINYEIREKMNEIIEEAKQRAKEYQKAVLETGGSLEDYHPIVINMDYEIKYSDNKIISFVITKSETLASAYTEQYFYNIDIQNGKELNLRDVLGENFKQLADEQITKQIEERKKNSDNSFFDEEMGGFSGIKNEYQDFYIDKQGNVVIVYPKYTIAPGYMGIQEFSIAHFI